MKCQNLYPYQLSGALTLDSFGMVMRERTYSSATYRFGYQGNEIDNEIENGIYITKYRELDTRISSWWSMDPLYDNEESPYSINHSNPIYFNDYNGDEPKPSLKSQLPSESSKISDGKSDWPPKWWPFKKHKEVCPVFPAPKNDKTPNIRKPFGINFGLRINNVVIFDIRTKDSRRSLSWDAFFPGRNGKKRGIALFYKVKQGGISFISNSDDHWILITKNRGYIEPGNDGTPAQITKAKIPSSGKRFSRFLAGMAELGLFWTQMIDDAFDPRP